MVFQHYCLRPHKSNPDFKMSRIQGCLDPVFSFGTLERVAAKSGSVSRLVWIWVFIQPISRKLKIRQKTKFSHHGNRCTPLNSQLKKRTWLTLFVSLASSLTSLLNLLQKLQWKWNMFITIEHLALFSSYCFFYWCHQCFLLFTTGYKNSYTSTSVWIQLPELREENILIKSVSAIMTY